MLAVDNLNMGKLEIQNVRIQNLASAPSSPAVGQMYYDTVLLQKLVWDGTVWQRASFATSPFARANHTGTQLASTISDFDTQVRTSRLDQMAVPTASVSFNSQRATSLADPTSAQDAATKNYVDAAIQGKSYKDAVRLATAAALATNTRTSNILTATANGVLGSIDGVTPAANDRILVKNEATGANNGIYTVTSVGSVGTPWIMTRATDADASSEVKSGMSMLVDEGTANQDSQFTLTTDDPITLNTTALVFAKTTTSGGTTYTAGNGLSLSANAFAVVAGNGIIADGTSTRVDPAVVGRKYTTTVGDGSSTSIAVTHSLGNQYVLVQVFDASTGALVVCDVTLTSSSVATVVFAVAPSSGAYRVVVVG